MATTAVAPSPITLPAPLLTYFLSRTSRLLKITVFRKMARFALHQNSLLKFFPILKPKWICKANVQILRRLALAKHGWCVRNVAPGKC